MLLIPKDHSWNTALLKTKGLALAPMNLVQGYGIEDIKAANLQQIVHVIQQLLFNQTNQENRDLGFWILVFSDFAEGLRSLGFRISGHGSGFRVLGF